MRVLLFVVILALEGILYCLAKAQSNSLFTSLKQDQDPLQKAFLPMGHFLLTHLGYQYNSLYDKKRLSYLAELHEPSQSRLYLQAHWAKKTGYLLLTLLLGSLLLAAAGKTDPLLVLFVSGAAVLIFLAPDYELHKQLEERHQRICWDFPDFLSKLILLINAGMTVSRAWEKAAASPLKKSPLYEEVTRVTWEIGRGKPETQALEEFARRCRTPEITRFITVVLQNLRKGNGELAAILRIQVTECWEMRKHTAKRKGEEAETKLLLPLMLMFVAILLIVATPALLALKNM